jgi:hypothetical protein
MLGARYGIRGDLSKFGIGQGDRTAPLQADQRPSIYK